MKKTILFHLAIIIFSLAHTQTKVETESWIVEKLNAANQTGLYYIPRSGEIGEVPPTNIMITDNKFKIENGNLVIMNCWEDYATQKDKSDLKVVKTYRKYFVPLNDIKTFSTTTYFDVLTIGTNTYSIVSYSNDKKSRSTSNIVYFGLNIKLEDDLLDRLNKALTHLKTFYPKVKKKEAF